MRSRVLYVTDTLIWIGLLIGICVLALPMAGGRVLSQLRSRYHRSRMPARLRQRSAHR